MEKALINFRGYETDSENPKKKFCYFLYSFMKFLFQSDECIYFVQYCWKRHKIKLISCQGWHITSVPLILIRFKLLNMGNQSCRSAHSTPRLILSGCYENRSEHRRWFCNYMDPIVLLVLTVNLVLDPKWDRCLLCYQVKTNSCIKDSSAWVYVILEMNFVYFWKHSSFLN